MSYGQLPAIVEHLRKWAVPEVNSCSDAELLERFTTKRESDAFAALMQRHGRMVWGVCRHVLRQEQDAEEAFQATFLVLARKAGSIRKNAAVASWLHGTAYHIARRARRDSATRRSHERKGGSMQSTEPAAEPAWREVLAILDEEVQKLAPRQRAVFVLCSLEGKSLAEAAQQLGWKEGTVSGTLSRAREQLRRRLARRGVELSAVLTGHALATESASAALVERTLHTALAFSLGELSAGTLSAPVASLVREATQTLLVTKLRLLIFMLAAAAIATGMAGFARPKLEDNSATDARLLARPADAASPERGPRERTDRFGDPLPPGAVARLGTIRLRHTAGRALAFSKDGKHLISCGRDGEVRVWDAATGELVQRTRLAGKAREYIDYGGISVAPDGATAATWDGKTAYLYDTATGRERGRLLSSAPVLAFSPDGKKIAVQAQDKDKNGPVQLWDIDEFKKNLTLDAPPGIALNGAPFAIAKQTAAFTPDGKLLAVLGGEREKERFVGAGNKELLVWDTVTGKLRQRKKFRAAMCSLAYSPDGAALAAGLYGEGEAVVFEAATLKEKAALPARANVKITRFTSVSVAGFACDGRLLVGGCFIDGIPLQEQGFLIWDLSGPKEPRWLPTSSFITAFALAPDGKTLACCTNIQYGGGNAIDLWDVGSGRRLHQLAGHDTPVSKLAVSPDGKILASSDYKPTLHLWDTATGKPLRSLAGWDEFASDCLLFSADGRRLISVSRKGKLQMWETATGKELCRFAINSPGDGVYPGYGVALLDKGKRVVAVTGLFSTQLSIWDAATGEQLNQRLLSAVQPTPSQGDVELAPDGESAAVWRGDRLTIEDVSTKNLLARLPRGVGNPLGFSADGRLLAVFLQPRNEHAGWWDPNPILEKYDVKGLSLIETASGQEVVRLDIRRFDYVAFTPDGRAIVVTDKQKLSVWDAATGERLHQIEWPESVRDEHGDAKISSLVVLPDGRAATGMTEGDVLIWDLAPSTWPVHRPMRELSRDQFDALWSDLARNASTAYRAVAVLAASPAWSVPLLGTHLHPVAVDDKRIDKFLADLEDERYEVRDAASRELAQLRDHAEPRLRRTLEGSPSLEIRRRLEAILAEPKHPTTEALRTLRSIALLERIGTPEARQVLKKLAAGAGARETREATASLERLDSGAHRSP
jgi:RNA polymerase sigma factor (sigma-70 family)